MRAPRLSARRLTFVSVMLAVTVGAVLATAYSLWRLREETIHSRFVAASMYAHAFEDHLTHSLNVIDLTLANIGDDEPTNLSLVAALRHAPYLRSLSRLDATGRIVASSDLRNRGKRIERRDFQPPGSEPVAVLRVGLPWSGRDFYEGSSTTSAASEPGFIPILRDLDTGEGQWATMLASMNSDYFLNHYGHNIAADVGAVELLRYDGVLMFSTDEAQRPGVRRDGDPVVAMVADATREEFGHFEQIRGDGRAVLTAFRSLSRYPFVIAVHLDKEHGLAGWRQEAARVVLLIAAALLGSLALACLYFVRLERAARQRDEAEAALRASEERFRAATNSASDAIVSVDANGDIVAWNPATERLFGYDGAELTGRDLSVLIPPRFWQDHRSGMQRLQAGGESHIMGRLVEVLGRRKDGGEFPLELSLAQWSTAEGRFYTGTMRDITQRKQQEERIRALLAELETIFKNALVGIAHLNNRCIVTCNRRFEEIFGYESGELIGASTERLCDSPEAFVAFGEHAYRAIADSGRYSEEIRLKRKDGSFFWGALTGCAIDPACEVGGSIWICADISERRQAEQESNKLLRAVEQSPVTILIVDRDGLIEYVNPRFTQITGYTREEAMGRTPRILQSGLTSPEVYDDLWRTIFGGKMWRGVLRNKRKTGELIWENVSISPIFDDNGAITHFVGVEEDVSERIRVQQQLEDHQAQLEETVRRRTAELTEALDAAKVADRTKDAFLANVSHELRTPLSAVIGLSGLARRLGSDPRQRDYLDKVMQAGKMLSSLINDLLDLSKIAAGRMEFESKTFGLRELLRRNYAVMSYKAEEAGLELIENIDDETPDILVGDSLRLEQILLNLIGNAIKFTAKGRVEVRVGVHAREERRVALKIEVEDSGVGMSAEDIAHLFQPFSQADPSIGRKYGGTGLGLSICKRLAQMMDGDIDVVSREGRGSTFHVVLRLGLGQAVDMTSEVGEAEQATMRYRDAQVLVVDDQPFNREVVAGLLEVVGITAHMAGNGREALEILDRAGPTAFDLVLMDIRMPVMDGLSATRELRMRPGYAELPIIAITAHNMAHESEIGRDAGMNDQIGKPFDDKSFHRMLIKWIDRRKHVATRASSNRPAMAAVTAVAAPPSELPSLHGVDMEAGLARLVGDRARYRHWLVNWAGEAPAYLQQIRRHMDDRQEDQAGLIAHTLKGSAGLLGMGELQALAAALEAALENGEAAERQLADLQQAIGAMCAQIAQAFDLSAAAAQ